MTWEILMGLLTLISALAGFAKIIANNTRVMTELQCTVAVLRETSAEQRHDIGQFREDMQSLSLRVHDLERGGIA